jgi:hypothetical protein
MAAGGWSRSAIHLANIVFALMCPLAAAVAAWGLTGSMAAEQPVIGYALAFAAGVFLCIALADLLPEVAFHAHDRLALTVALLLGIGLAWGIGLFETGHAHGGHEQHVPHQHAAGRPLVIEELACGNLSKRKEILGLLAALPRVTTASAYRSPPVHRDGTSAWARIGSDRRPSAGGSPVVELAPLDSR